MANQNILEYPEATQLADDDYILLDSVRGGTSKILASYFGSHEPEPTPIDYLYKWDFTKSLTDEVAGKTATLTGATRTNDGVIFNASKQYMEITGIDFRGKTLEVDVPSFDYKGNDNFHTRFIIMRGVNGSYIYGFGPLIYRKNTGWSAFGSSSYNTYTTRSWSDTWSNELTGTNNAVKNYFNGKTIKLVFSTIGDTTTLYVNNVLMGSIDNLYTINVSRTLLFGGTTANTSASDTDQCYDMIISGIRIYENLEV